MAPLTRPTPRSGRQRGAPPRRRAAAAAAAAAAASAPRCCSSLLLVPLSLLLLLSSRLPAAHALYEDQAGTFDWYRPFFGRITSAAFLPGKPRLLVAAPGNGLVGAIDTSPLASSAAAIGGAGPIAWRRPHPRDDPFAGSFALAARPPVAVVASAGGRVLRAWDAADGPFRWEAVLPRTAFERGGGGHGAADSAAAAAAPDDAALAASAALSHAVATADAPAGVDGALDPAAPSVVVAARAAPLDASGERAELQVEARDAARGELLWRAALEVAGAAGASGPSPSPSLALPRVLVSADAGAGTATVAWWSDGASELLAATFALGGRDTPPGLGSKPAPPAAAAAAAAGGGAQGLAPTPSPPPSLPPAREPMGPVRVWFLPAPLRASAPAALTGNALAVAAAGGLVCATAEAAATRKPGANERPGPLGCAPPPATDGAGAGVGVEVAALVPGGPDGPTFLAAYAGASGSGGGGGGGVAIFSALVGRDAEPVLVKSFPDATAVSAAVLPATAAAAGKKPRWVSAVVAAPAAASSSAAAVAAVAAAAARRATLVRIVDAATGEVLSGEKSALPPSVAGAHARRHNPRAAPAVPRLAVLSAGGASSSGGGGAVAKPSSSAPSPSLQVATVWSDHALTLSSGRLVAWVRDEALGTLDDSAFVDLPTAGQQQQQQQEGGAPSSSSSASSSPAAHPDAALHALGHHDRLRAWLRLQYVSALVQLHVATPAERFEQRALRGALSDRALAHRDANGLRKLVLGVSGGAGKAVALHNGDGHVVWEHDLPPVGGGARAGAGAGAGLDEAAAAAVAQAAAAAAGAKKTRLATWRTFHDTQHAPQVAVVRLVDGSETSDGRARARVDVLDAHTGAAVPIGGGGGIGAGGEGGAADDSGQEFVLPAGTEPQLVALPFNVMDDGGGGGGAAAAAEQRVFLLLAVPTAAAEGGGDDASLPEPPAIVALLPRGGAAALAALRARRPAPRFWLLRGGGPGAGSSSSAPALEGYEALVSASNSSSSLSSSPSSEQQQGEEAGAAVSLSRVWRVELPGPVLAAAARPPGQPLHSAVKVLGDRTLRVKHTDPNTLVAVCDASASAAASAAASASAAAAAVSASAASGGGVASALAVEALVVDGATGRVLHRALHPGGRGPASALASEHWAAYAFEDAGRMRHQISVAELYSRAPVPLSLGAAVSGAAARAVAASGGGGGGGGGGGAPSSADGDAGSPSSSSPSPQAPPRPAVASQSFYVQRPVVGLAVTATAAGITPQQLLVSTADGRVAALDRRFVDARRPVLLAGRKVTPAEQEEGLIPYQDTLPVWGAMHATYHHSVAALRPGGVSVAPAGLESVCLLFARGSDLFATRLAPAKHFDALEPDFNYALLVAALAALAVGAAFARFSSRRAVVKAKWQ